MLLTEAQMKSLHKAAEPLIKWLNENMHPHATVIVDQTSAELLESIAHVSNYEHVKD